MVIIKERINEPLSDILAFYDTVNYKGGAKEEDKIILAFDDESLIGVVRVSVEEDKPILRGMFISEAHRGQNIGKRMIKHLTPYLDELNNTSYCIPHAHLEKFYGEIGYKKTDHHTCPAFLKERMEGYVDSGYDLIIMKREV